MYTSKWLNNIVLSILSGILLIISFPFTGGLNLLSFVALIPLLVAEDKCFLAKKSSFKVFLLAYLTFFIYNLGTTWWIAYADVHGAEMAVIANALIMAIFFTLFHFVKRNVGVRQGYFALLFLWLTFEYNHYHWELSWPWLNFGNMFANAPILVQWYEYTGVLGGTMWILLMNILIFKLYRDTRYYKIPFKEQQIYTGITMLIFAIPIAFSIAKYSSYEEIKDPIEVVVTQPNINPYTEKYGNHNLNVKEQLDRFINVADSLTTSKTDFVLAPETSIPYEVAEENFESTEIYTYLEDAVKKWNGPSLFLGAATTLFYKKKHSNASKLLKDGFYESYNTSLLIKKNTPVHFIHKSKLVLGVEVIPFSSVFPALERWALDLGGTSGSLGVADKIEVLSDSKVKFVPLVCYESIYGAYVAEFTKLGGEVIFIITNDGWWEDTPGYKQHFAFARLRAIETRRSVARSANTGISGFINQRGDVISSTKWNEQTALKAKINLNKKVTFYAKNGDLIGYSTGFVSMFLVLLALVKFVQNRMIKRQEKKKKSGK